MIALYQDSVKTTPVTASGDPVGAVVLTDGTVGEFIQATAGNRPIYRSNGTLGWLEHNGVAHTMDANYAPMAYPITMAIAVSGNSPFESPMALIQDANNYKQIYQTPDGWGYGNTVGHLDLPPIFVEAENCQCDLIALRSSVRPSPSRAGQFGRRGS